MIFQVPYWDIDNVWPKVAEFVQKALDKRNEFSQADIIDACKRQQMQLWIVPWNIAVVTQIQTMPRVRRCVLVLCGGNGLDETNKHELDAIKAWAKSLACTEMLIDGRDGWTRIYPEFKKIAVTLRAGL
ncbi:MAG: hypothetical protein ACREHG_07960 [Candidatus Saccharimonadales bacterium]